MENMIFKLFTGIKWSDQLIQLIQLIRLIGALVRVDITPRGAIETHLRHHSLRASVTPRGAQNSQIRTPRQKVLWFEHDGINE